MQDPQFFRNPEVGFSRDGCRVPLPWARSGESLGFGPGGSHLPQPAWYVDYSVEAQESNAGSTLELYRKLNKLRRELQTAEEFAWVKHLFNRNVLHFKRPNGWQSITNFGSKPIKLPKGRLLVSTMSLVDGKLAPNSTAWLA